MERNSKLLFTALFTLASICATRVDVEATEYEYNAAEMQVYQDAQQEVFLYAQDGDVRMHLSGYDREEGILSLYLGSGAGDDDMDDIAHYMNDIEPGGEPTGFNAAVGIRFELDF